MESKTEYDYYDDRDLVDMYIFYQPLHINPVELEKELKKRGLLDYARDMFDKLYGIFDDEWGKRNK